jgi:hypothetical protein
MTDQQYEDFISLGKYTEEEVPYEAYKDLFKRFADIFRQKLNEAQITTAAKQEVRRKIQEITIEDLCLD